jgi:hypothetical protein
MLRFAWVAATLGLGAAAIGLLVNERTPIEEPSLLFGLFVAAVLVMIAAGRGHPDATRSGSESRLSFRDIVRSAPWWSTALALW